MLLSASNQGDYATSHSFKPAPALAVTRFSVNKDFKVCGLRYGCREMAVQRQFRGNPFQLVRASCRLATKALHHLRAPTFLSDQLPNPIVNRADNER